MRLTRTLTAILAALPLGAMAEEHHKGPPGAGADNGGQRQGPPIGAMLERIEQIASIVEAKDGDKDAAEKIAKWEEAIKDKPEFKRLDTDGDGKISRDEAKAAFERFQTMLKERNPDLFAKIDANGDGKLSLDELRAAREKYRQEHPEGAGGAKGGDEGGGGGGDKPKADDPDAGKHRDGNDK